MPKRGRCQVSPSDSLRTPGFHQDSPASVGALSDCLARHIKLGAFKYGPALQKNQIRLLGLASGERGSCIESKLDTKPIGDVKYNALSYVWGSPERTHKIICNDQQMAVTANLYLMLSRLREDYGDEKGQCYLWIDALCINQDDTKEKTAQVQRMSSIYKEAKEVMVWLGEEDESTASGIDLLDKLCAAFPSANGEDIRSSFLDTEQLPKPSKPRVLADLGLPDTVAPPWYAASKILDAPWFTRRWVLQEMASARKCCFRIGSFEAASETILGGIYRIINFREFKYVLTLRQREHGDRVEAMVQLLRAQQSEYLHEALTDVLYETAAFESSDDRDRVFAIIGCLKAHEPRHLVSYSRSLPEVLHDVATCEKDSDELKLSLLRGLCFIDEPSSEPNIPSWMPTWYFKTPHFKSLFDFHESDGTDTDQATVRVLDNGKVLETGAILFDVIDTLVSLAPVVDGLPIQSLDGETQRKEFVRALRGYCTWLSQCEKAATCCNVFTSQDRDARTLPPADKGTERFIRCYLFGDDLEDVDGVKCYDAYKHHAAMWFARDEVGNDQNDLAKLTTRYDEHCRTLNIQPDPRVCQAGSFADVLQWHSEVVVLADQWALIESRHRFGRQFLTSKSGRIGWAPSTAQPGDQVAVFLGFATTFVLRSASHAQTGSKDADLYTFVGACYVDERMEGEVFLDDTLPRTTVRLV